MRVVLFDLDGTLIDTAALYAEAYRRAFVAHLPDPPTAADMWRRKPSSERRFLLDWFGEELGDRLHTAMCDAYDELTDSLHGGLYAGVEEMLDQLRADGVRLAAVTGKSRRAFRSTCRRIPLADRFETLVFEDDVDAPKPDPQGLKRALATLGVGPREAVYVGDTPMDLEAARRAAIRPAAALWSRTTTERARWIAALDPAVWPLAHPSDLLARLR